MNESTYSDGEKSFKTGEIFINRVNGAPYCMLHCIKPSTPMSEDDLSIYVGFKTDYPHKTPSELGKDIAK